MPSIPAADDMFARDTLERSRTVRPAPAIVTPPSIAAVPTVGVISNARSHRNRKGLRPTERPDILYAAPATQADLLDTLRDYAARGVDTIVVDGGDGTVRDVLSAAGKVFTHMPRLAVLPSGKTNALALDLGIPDGWTVDAAIDAVSAGRFATRSPLEISRGDAAEPELRGFLLGAGGFVRGTELAQRTHKAGAFNGVAVGLSVAWSIVQTMFGGTGNAWRAGEPMHIRDDDGGEIDQALYLLLASTLELMPLGLKPLGKRRAGLKMLTIDAPPRYIPAAVVPLLGGWEPRWLAKAGYRRADSRGFRMTLGGPFILDGEHYDGGELHLRRGAPLHFAVP